MSMSGSEILRIVAYPFRIYNVNKLDIDTFIFTLSLQALENCNISTAKKILHLAIEQDKIKRIDNTVLALFDPWTLKIPSLWKPEFKGLENVPEVELESLPKIPPLEIKPILNEFKKGEVISEPFQFGMDLIEQIKLEEQKNKVEKIERKEITVQPREIKKIEKKPKENKTQIKKPKKKEIKQKTLLGPAKEIKKPKKKTKTLIDFM